MPGKTWIFVRVVLTMCALIYGLSTILTFAQADETFDTQPVEALLEQKGDPITFSYSDKYEKERQIVRQVLGIKPDEVSHGKNEMEDMGIALRDIDGDGKDEILACFYDGRRFYYKLIRNAEGTWRPLDEWTTDQPTMTILTTKSHGYFDIRFDNETFDYPDKTTATKTVLRFDGRQFRYYAGRTRVYDYARKKETTSTSLFQGVGREWSVVLP